VSGIVGLAVCNYIVVKELREWPLREKAEREFYERRDREWEERRRETK
jgi:hypothetical protein